MEFICAWCGLVIQADDTRGQVWLTEHINQYHGHYQDGSYQPPRAVFTAIDTSNSTMPRLPITLASLDNGTVTRRWSDWPWAACLTVDDAAFLASLQIDPS